MISHFLFLLLLSVLPWDGCIFIYVHRYVKWPMTSRCWYSLRAKYASCFPKSCSFISFALVSYYILSILFWIVINIIQSIFVHFFPCITSWWIKSVNLKAPYLRGLALTLIEFKFTRKSKQVLHVVPPTQGIQQITVVIQNEWIQVIYMIYMIYIIYTSEMSEIYAAQFVTRGGLAAPFHICTRVLVLQTCDDNLCLWLLCCVMLY